MDHFLFQDYPEGKRQVYLRDNCADVESVGYMRRFTPDELAEMKDSLSDISIELAELEEQKKEMMKRINEKIEAARRQKAAVLAGLKNKSEYVKEDCYKFIDEDSHQAGYYNAKGELIQTRPLKPEEMQRSLLSAIRTGTND